MTDQNKLTSEELIDLYKGFLRYKHSFVPKHSYGYGVGINHTYSLSLYYNKGEGCFILTEPMDHKVEISKDEYDFLLDMWKYKFEKFNIELVKEILTS